MKLVIAGGGTAGHLFPGIALAIVMEQRGHDVLFIGSSRGPEVKIVPGAGFRLETVLISGRGKGISIRNIRAIARLLKATARCLVILARFNPDVVVGTGGYVSLPAVFAAAIHRIPIVVHEQNAVPGLANRIAWRFAKRVAVSFPGSEERFGAKAVLTGNPVRTEIASMDRASLRQEAITAFGLAPGRITIVVTGGSQGARSINEAVLDLYVRWRFEETIQVLHLTGRDRFEEVSQALGDLRRTDDRVVWKAYPFTDRMDLFYAVADLAICRAGASTIAETTAVGVPAIYVPLPIAIDDDQRRNAEAVVTAGAGRMVADSDLRSELTSAVSEMLSDPELLDEMAKRAKALARPEAAALLADLVAETSGQETFDTSPEEHRPPGANQAAPWRKVHMVGIGGAGMSAMALILKARGSEVTGSDRNDSEVLARLDADGIEAVPGHDASLVDTAEVVIVSNAVPEDNPEIAEARARGIPVLWRGEALAKIFSGQKVIGVTGTHGKTTTSAMIATVLAEAGLDPTYLIGGEPVGLGAAGRSGAGEWAVVEADEAYGTFLNLHPAVGVITNVDVDHLDHYGSVESYRSAFSQFASQSEAVVVCADDETAVEAARDHPNLTTYGFSQAADVSGVVLETADGLQLEIGWPYDLVIPLATRGLHNASNALAAIAASVQAGVDPEVIAAGLSSFRGVSRRMEFRGWLDGAAVYDDYAHLPSEVEATLMAFPGAKGRLIAVFQPHLYSRTRLMANEFGVALSLADLVVVTDVYPAREEPIPGVTGKLVADAVCEAVPGRKVAYLPTLEQAAIYIKGEAREGDVVVSLGAGDVTTIPDRLLTA